MSTQASADQHKRVDPPASFTDSEFLLSSIRTATLRARLVANELDTIGVALKRDLVSVEGALAWLHDVDLLHHV